MVFLRNKKYYHMKIVKKKFKNMNLKIEMNIKIIEKIIGQVIQIKHKDNWNGWSDFLGTGRKKPQRCAKILSHDDCKAEVKKYEFKNSNEYRNNRKNNWPSNPNKT